MGKQHMELNLNLEKKEMLIRNRNTGFGAVVQSCFVKTTGPFP